MTMRPYITMMLIALGALATPARALPRLDAHHRLATSQNASTAPDAISHVRLVCNYHRCYRTGYWHPYYRPYGYYRPYYYGPHLGVGIGPLGVGIY